MPDVGTGVGASSTTGGVVVRVLVPGVMAVRTLVAPCGTPPGHQRLRKSSIITKITKIMKSDWIMTRFDSVLTRVLTRVSGVTETLGFIRVSWKTRKYHENHENHRFW